MAKRKPTKKKAARPRRDANLAAFDLMQSIIERTERSEAAPKPARRPKR